MSDQIKFTPPTEAGLNQVELNQVEHPAWDEPVICRVEVDLPGWLTKLTGQSHWEVYSEEEEENCISFGMRSLQTRGLHKAAELIAEKDMQAEVTLYHNGYAVVDVNGQYCLMAHSPMPPTTAHDSATTTSAASQSH